MDEREYTLEELKYIFKKYVNFPPNSCTAGVCYSCVRIVIYNDEEGLAFEICNRCNQGYCDSCYRKFMSEWARGRVDENGNIVCDNCLRK